MKLIDSHCHLNMLDLSLFDGDVTNAVKRAADNHVTHMLSVCVELGDVPVLKNLAEQFSNVDISVGLHPNEAVEIEPTVEDFVQLADHPNVVAIGETGLDYYRTDQDNTFQAPRFRTQIAAARETKKPLIIHTRMAREDTITIMREEKADEIRGVMHCFTEDWDMAKKALDLGFYISFSGIVTFKNAKDLQEVAQKVPLDRMLIETDCPYLAPMPHRGKPNEPAYVLYVAEKIAELRKIPLKDVADQTTQNYFDLFHA